MSLQAIREFCLEQGKHKTYWIAFSGGLDSHVLLSLCHSLRAELNLDLRAIHIHHGLSPNANAWSTHCKKICDDFAIEYFEERIKINLKSGESLEEKAREQRYKIFSNYINHNSILLTAHHQDDQAETFLLQLCRGAGVKGLSAMPKIKLFANGLHARPLLNCSQEDLKNYAEEKKLIWLEDESNQNQNFSRNFIRHQVLPILKLRWPSAANSITRSAEHCAESQVLLREFSQNLFLDVQGSRENTLSVKKLLQLDLEKQRLILREWIQKLNYSLPSTKIILTIQQNILTAAQDKLPSVNWSDVTVKRYRDDIFLLSNLIKPKLHSALSWNVNENLKLPHGSLQIKKEKGKGLSANIKNVFVNLRQGGEILEMPLRGGSHSLKKLFQEWNVPVWERDCVPLIFVEEKLIAVVGYFLNENFAAKENEVGKEIIFVLDDELA